MLLECSFLSYDYDVDDISACVLHYSKLFLFHFWPILYIVPNYSFFIIFHVLVLYVGWVEKMLIVCFAKRSFISCAMIYDDVATAIKYYT